MASPVPLEGRKARPNSGKVVAEGYGQCRFIGWSATLDDLSIQELKGSPLRV